MRPTIALPIAFALSASIAPEAGCISVPSSGEKPVLATHVQDWRDEVIYQLMVDRFADGDVNNDFHVQPGALARHQGGDWKGIQDHLDYLDALGVTALWISPVVKNVDTDADVDAYHGYWAQDLTQVNPHFGDLAALRSMVAAAHDRGMKVVLDIVTNHMGQVFFYDMNENGHPDVYVFGTGTTSPLTRMTEFDPDWDARGVQAFTSLGLSGRAPILFVNDPSINRVAPDCLPQPCILARADGYHGFGRILNYDDDHQRLLGDFPGGLKDVATELDDVRTAMVATYANWVEQADFDGFRIDTVKHIEHGFWQVFTQSVRAELASKGKNDFLMFGEAFDGNDALVGSYTVKGELDSVFYFPQHFQVYRDVYEMAHDPKQQKGTKQIADLWSQKQKNYGTQPQDQGIGVAPYQALVNFIDNHDVARFLFDSGGDVAALRNALSLLFTEDGVPCMYYGTEQEFSGGNDPANREVLWLTRFATDGDTFTHVAKLARIRKAYAALRRGATSVVWSSAHVAQEEDAGVFAFERAGGDAGGAYALVVANTNAFKSSSTSDGATVMQTKAPETTLVDVLDPQQASYTADSSGKLRVSVPAQKTMILVPKSQVVAL